MEWPQWRKNPEELAQSAEAMHAKPFEVMTNQVPESAVLALMKDSMLVSTLTMAHWPTDEVSCNRIGKSLGLDAEQVAAVSKYQRSAMAEEKEGKQLH